MHAVILETHGKRQNYVALNDGYDSEALPEDRLSSPNPGLSTLPELDTFLDIPDLEINPYESLSQSLSYSIGSTAADSSIVSYASEALQKQKKEG
ncbi:hypothetical protein N7467_003504 [Penicillium canescens]|nr:hypothetical protein N7467_003504 [Penicillium canescens]